MTMHPTKDQVAFFNNDRSVQVWNYAESPREEAIKVKLPERGKPIFSPDGEWIAIGDTYGIEGKLISIVDATNGVVRNSFQGTMTDAPWFPDSSSLVVVRGPTHRVEIVNAGTGELEHFLEETGEIQAGRGAIWPFVSEDGRVVTTVARNRPKKNEAGWIRTWDASTGGLLKEFQFTCSVGWTETCVDVNHKTNRVAIGAENRTVEIWDTESASLWRTVRTPGVIHFSIDLSADGDRLYIGEYGNELTVHDFDTEREIELGSGGTFAFSPDGKQVVVINEKQYVVCDVETTRPLITLLEGRDLGPVDWSSDGKRIAAAGKDDLYIWTLPQRP
jgi:WD40 repeat protein